MADNCMQTDVNGGKIVKKGRGKQPVFKVEDSADTLQDLVRRYQLILEEIEQRVRKQFPIGQRVEITQRHGKTVGKVNNYVAGFPTEIGCLLPSGNVWSYSVETIRVI